MFIKNLIALFIVFFITACDNNTVDIFDNDTNSDVVNNDIISFESEPYSNTQWAIKYNKEFYEENNIAADAHINPEETYDKYLGTGIKIAIIDDGFDTSHLELQGRILDKINFSGSGDSYDVTHTNSDDYHGTAVGGIISANANKIGIRGIAPNAQLILIKMGEYNTDEETINMFKYAVDAGADIISCSWGTYNVSDSVKAYIDDISTNKRDGKGVIIVFASGNDNQNMENDESSIESVVGVGATDHTALRTSYSNYGSALDVVAPGGDYYGDYGISTLDPLGSFGITDDEYNLYGYEVSFIGTSASAPIVSGAIALALESNPDLTREEVQNLLKTTSDKIGLNLPYIEDYDIINEKNPTLTGILGSQNNSDFKLIIISYEDNTIYGPYSINIDGNSWSSIVTDELSEGFYKALLVESGQVLATEESFEINLSKESSSNGLRNDYYGYGKINLSKLVEASLALK
ncbi:MAG: S8 family serine peptidase [Campylobacterota bacterium]|nr:S8 family serine peptidase [Campylobacterota bacterium]